LGKPLVVFPVVQLALKKLPLYTANCLYVSLPPTDIINSFLILLYSLLLNNIISIVLLK